MINDGALDGVDSIFGIHLWADIETGKVSVAKDGTLIADVREDVLKKILINNIVTKRFTNIEEKKNNSKKVLTNIRNFFKNIKKKEK